MLTKTKINYNSEINQRILRKFVNREVYCNMHNEVEYILNQNDDNAPFTYDDIENLYHYCCPNCEEIIRYDEDENYYECVHCNFVGEKYELIEMHNEIFEWYTVTNWLCEKLRQYGETIIETDTICYWGRSAGGQEIMLDSVIKKICTNMEILEEQKYSWSEYL